MRVTKFVGVALNAAIDEDEWHRRIGVHVEAAPVTLRLSLTSFRCTLARQTVLELS
jgi:hypothetical protein